MTDKHVLVIDDEQVILDSVSRILTEEGFTVDTAIDSRRGLERALDGGYDLVLTDIRMPEIGGMRILRDIKRANPGVPVIIFTGYATVQSAVQAMKLGAADYVEKPFTPDALFNTVMAAIEKASEEEPEEQGLVNRSQVIEVLDRAAVDGDFLVKLLYEGADALESYTLTGAEKLAILTGDLPWIEEHLGPLTREQRRWLEQRLNAEIW